MWHNPISGVYGRISLKFCTNVGLWTLMKGKILWSGYLYNSCYGNEKTSWEPWYCLICRLQRVMEVKNGFCLLPCYLHVAMATKKSNICIGGHRDSSSGGGMKESDNWKKHNFCKGWGCTDLHKPNFLGRSKGGRFFSVGQEHSIRELYGGTRIFSSGGKGGQIFWQYFKGVDIASLTSCSCPPCKHTCMTYQR